MYESRLAVSLSAHTNINTDHVSAIICLQVKTWNVPHHHFKKLFDNELVDSQCVQCVLLVRL